MNENKLKKLVERIYNSNIDAEIGLSLSDIFELSLALQVACQTSEEVDPNRIKHWRKLMSDLIGILVTLYPPSIAFFDLEGDNSDGRFN